MRLLLSIFIILFYSCKESPGNSVRVPGIGQSVEVFRDPYGINHIYAGNESDLFFAQGYLAAKDRLFQFEIWRRQATGRVAEILGPRELKRDIGTRLFMFRGDMKEEILTLYGISKKLKDKRFKNGSINFEREEVKFHLAEDGTPTA